MRTLRYKLEKKGYLVTNCLGYKNGVETTNSVMAKKGQQTYKAKNITQLYKLILS